MRLRSIGWVALIGLGCSAPPAPPPPNELPVAVAGAAVTVQLGHQVIIDGSGSVDPDGDELTFSWVAAAGNPAPVPMAMDQIQFSFSPTVAGSYWFALTVNDGELSSLPDSVQVTAVGGSNRPPSAVVASDYSIYEFGATMILDAINSTDPDGDSLTYVWRLIDSGNADADAVDIADSTARQTPVTIAAAGEYLFALEVDDGRLSARTEFRFRVEPAANQPPLPVISGLDEGELGVAITLDGSATADPDGDVVELHWIIVDPSGIRLSLPDSTAAMLTFTPAATGVYVVLLEADDGSWDPVRARTEINVLEAVYNQRQGMIEVPGGAFVMGSEMGGDDEIPVHLVHLSLYWIDKYEVTVSQYQKCVDAKYCAAPGDGSKCNSSDDPDRAQHPVNCVNWQQASDYCLWADRRLPTEAEWEKAARGTDGRRFVWGDAYPSSDLLNYNREIGFTTQVGTYPLGVSFYGLHNMGGNVYEWTADYYDDEAYGAQDVTDPAGPGTGSNRVARGASWELGVPLESLTATTRHNFLTTYMQPTLGLRCARSTAPSE
jgi:formylglycine-generating enzyme required for sulfatase activity